MLSLCLLLLLKIAISELNILFIEAGLNKVNIDAFARSLNPNAQYQVLEESKSDYDMIICGSRGATIISMLLHHNTNWNGNIITFSPILRKCDLFQFDLDENYEKGWEIVLDIWQKSQVNFCVGIGDSVDEQMLIYDPLLEALKMRPELKERINLKQYKGDHDWISESKEPYLDDIRSFIDTFSTCSGQT